MRIINHLGPKLRESNCSNIEVFLQGGLGNQLFQFACGYSLALDIGLSIQMIHTSKKRKYALDNFGIPEKKVLLLKDSELMVVKKQRHSRSCNFQPLTEASLKFEPLVLTSDHIRLHGYRQAIPYFERHSSAIRSLLYSESKHRVLSEANDTDLVIHIRLGDYVKSSTNRNIYAENRDDYVMSSLDYFNFSGNEKIVVVTDDSKLLKEMYPKLMKLSPKIFRGSDFESFQFIQTVKKKIITNSTFSWWAAWLGGGEVVAPERWFKSSSGLQIFSDQFYPQEWHRI